MASRVHREHLILYSIEILLKASSKGGARKYMKDDLANDHEISPKTMISISQNIRGKRSYRNWDPSPIKGPSPLLGDSMNLTTCRTIALG